ncbi:hypothetical protein FQN57_000569 [Myotisia sp. PD_48]|nr:hypothetical protein FQN57_000569 [Myotisia sp. PD_48]
MNQERPSDYLEPISPDTAIQTWRDGMLRAREKRTFDRFASNSELSHIEFEMALDVEEQDPLAAINVDNTALLLDKKFVFSPPLNELVYEENGLEPLKKSPCPDCKAEQCHEASMVGGTEASGSTITPIGNRVDDPDDRTADTIVPKSMHRRLTSDPESYTTLGDNPILYDKDANVQVSSQPYKSPYMGPVGWTVPSRYYSHTSVVSSCPNAGEDNDATSPGRNTKIICRRAISRPFLIYQDPEWIEPPSGVDVDEYEYMTASDDKENIPPDSDEEGEMEVASEDGFMVGFGDGDVRMGEMYPNRYQVF